MNNISAATDFEKSLFFSLIAHIGTNDMIKKRLLDKKVKTNAIKYKKVIFRARIFCVSFHVKECSTLKYFKTRHNMEYTNERKKLRTFIPKLE